MSNRLNFSLLLGGRFSFYFKLILIFDFDIRRDLSVDDSKLIEMPNGEFLCVYEGLKLIKSGEKANKI